LRRFTASIANLLEPVQRGDGRCPAGHKLGRELLEVLLQTLIGQLLAGARLEMQSL
jgi:hypothetical protein